MANKRMINLKLVDTDLFLGMPMSARLLYYDFLVRADDEGFIASPKKIMKAIGASPDDLNILVTRHFIIPFESGVCVVSQWYLHNYIRSDRFNPTIYQDEKSSLILENKVYKKVDNSLGMTNDIPLVDKMDTQIKLDKINNNSSSNNIEVDEQNKTIFQIIEEEFGRTLSPMEYETIKSWNYQIDILKRAVKEASLSNNYSIKYIDKIIFNWKKANIKSIQDVEVYLKRFRDRKENRANQLETSSADYEEL